MPVGFGRNSSLEVGTMFDSNKDFQALLTSNSLENTSNYDNVWWDSFGEDAKILSRSVGQKNCNLMTLWKVLMTQRNEVLNILKRLLTLVT